MASVLLWNTRGLNDGSRQQALARIVQEHRPDFLFLSETKTNDLRLCRYIQQRLGFEHCEVVPSAGEEGRSGGLLLFWNDNFQCDILGTNQNYIDVLIKPARQHDPPWRFTGFYGFPAGCDKHKSWALIRELADRCNYPWVMDGDFNELMSREEKEGGRVRRVAQMAEFRAALLYADLKDMGFVGDNPFTWTTTRIKERLDRVTCNQNWLDRFPHSRVLHLPPASSDHNPLLLEVLTNPTVQRKKKYRFRFEELWTEYEECGQILRSSWNKASNFDPMKEATKKIQDARINIRAWAKTTFGERDKQINDTRNRLHVLQNMAFTDQVVEERRGLNMRLNALLADEAAYWRQRSKVTWLRDGDRNTSFFFRKASNRRAKNRISELYDENNVRQATEEGISKVVLDYYTNLFTAGTYDLQNMHRVVDLIVPRVTDNMNRQLIAPYKEEEIKAALFDMYPTKSPGPDGMTPLFFQHYWNDVGHTVVKAARHYLHTGTLLASANYTHICLIPKVPNPKHMKDLRPIALCNVLYKICAKAIATRLQRFLPQIVSSCQSAFVSGRQITDNTLVANEVCHFIHNKYSGSDGYMAIKLDMSKAYDRMEWSYLEEILLRLGFHPHWVKVVMQSVTTVSYSFLINGEVRHKIAPSRGLRQGDPLSPYLFVLCAEGFSALLEHRVAEGKLQGVRIFQGAPVVHHMLFADDSLLFGKASVEECLQFTQILHEYEAASGQQINLAKSEVVFSKKVGDRDKALLATHLGMQVVEKLEKYLGLPTYIGRYRTETFAYLRQKLDNRLQGWQGKALSGAAKELLIRVVAQTLPSYAMSMFLLPKDFCKELQLKMARFWWGGTEENPRRHWQKWERMCIPKEEGGLGFRSLYDHNLALLGKQVWSLYTNPHTLAAQILKAKYFPTTSVFGAHLSDCPSATWRSIFTAIPYVHEGCRWQIGDGSQIGIWFDRWIPDFPATGPQLREDSRISLPYRVCDLFEDGVWRRDRVEALFAPGSAEAILRIPLSASRRVDRLRWFPEHHGRYTVKSAYKRIFAANSDPNLVPNPIYNGLRKRIWFANIPPKIKVHMWRVCSGILPTVQALQMRHSRVTGGCKLCVAPVESLGHICYYCPFTQRVLQSCSLFAGALPSFPMGGTILDWLFSCMSLLSRCQFDYLLVLLWAVWGERNLRVWQNRFRNPESVEIATRVFYDGFINARNKRRQAPRQQPRVWSPPPPGKLKLNSDGAFFSSYKKGAWSFVVRNSDGNVCGGGCGYLSYVSSAYHAEITALHQGVLFAKARGLDGIFLESDSKQLVEDVFQASGTSEVLVEDIADGVHEIPHASLCYVPRTANKVAHNLAQFSYSTTY